MSVLAKNFRTRLDQQWQNRVTLSRGLVRACRAGDDRQAAEFVQLGADVDAANEDGQTAVYLAATGRSPECVRYLLANRADPNKADRNGQTALFHVACVASAEYLLQYGANVNARDVMGNTAISLLFTRSRFVDLDLFQLLIQYGADVNLQNRRGWNPLFYAVLAGTAYSPCCFSIDDLFFSKGDHHCRQIRYVPLVAERRLHAARRESHCAQTTQVFTGRGRRRRPDRLERHVGRPLLRPERPVPNAALAVAARQREPHQLVWRNGGQQLDLLFLRRNTRSRSDVAQGAREEGEARGSFARIIFRHSQRGTLHLRQSQQTKYK